MAGVAPVRIPASPALALVRPMIKNMRNKNIPNNAWIARKTKSIRDMIRIAGVSFLLTQRQQNQQGEKQAHRRDRKSSKLIG